jgi:arsenate reductase (glutaredoxin)
MSEIATAIRQITFIYNSESVRAKKALALAQTKELPIWEIDVMKTKLTGAQLASIANDLDLPISELVNREHPYFKEQFGDAEFSDMEWLTMIEHNPQILKQPIVMLGDKTILVDTPTDVLQL